MTKDHTRSFQTKSGEFTARILPGAFPTNGGSGPPVQDRSDRKFNIRIRQDDILLLDALSKNYGVTRSALINSIIHDVMVDELMSVEELDARVLIAHLADLSVSYNDIDQPWIHDALGPEFRFILNNVLDGSDAMTGQPADLNAPAGYTVTEEDYRSPVYMALRDKLKDILK